MCRFMVNFYWKPLIKSSPGLFFLLVLSSAVTDANADTVRLSCKTTPTSHIAIQPFDIKFENDLEAVSEVELCYKKCLRANEQGDVYKITSKSTTQFKFLKLLSKDAPSDANHWTFNFDKMEIEYAFYQLPFLGSLEMYKAMGGVGEPNREWKRLGFVRYKCKKRLNQIID